jgi:hypothetical protein
LGRNNDVVVVAMELKAFTVGVDGVVSEDRIENVQ